MRISEFAIISDWESRLGTLAELAEPERWSYRYVPDSSARPILDSYVRHTFERLSELGRISMTETLACFNTGLMTPNQEELFGIFSLSEKVDPNRPIDQGNKKWFLKAWAKSSSPYLRDFSVLPELATYWVDPADLVFNPALEVRKNVDHILRDNLSRFPEELGGRVGIDGVPKDLSEDAAPADSAPPSNYLPARHALEGALGHAVELARRSYRISVPQFYRGSIQLLLPLYLRGPNRPDLALTLEKHDGWYRASTVLYPDWAYRHARLLSRPNSEWLGGFREDLAS